ncbi:ABC transporter permease [Bordetella pertussis]|uniref:ABC transporter permease n=1 Tax=Bordetella pertussis TaxID=520 RepID=UPI0028E39081|nr:ABC transporter permease [Bordetella pertussis]WNR05644.1 ABC transporter permease [Bordetella pertussis]
MTSILRHNRLALLGGGVLLLMVAISVAASWIASTDPAMSSRACAWTPPGEAFCWAPMRSGADVYSRVVHGSRMSLAIGALVVLITIAIGHPHRPGGRGLAHHGPRPHADHGRRHGIPGILLAVALVSLFGASLASGRDRDRRARDSARGAPGGSVVLSVREEPYVEAAVGLGVPYPKVVWRHILPNCFVPLIVQPATCSPQRSCSRPCWAFWAWASRPRSPPFGNILAEARPVLPARAVGHRGARPACWPSPCWR